MGKKSRFNGPGLFDQDVIDGQESGVRDNGGKTKRVAGGVATTDLVFSAQVGDNADLFAKILDLHVPKRATVADVTFGQGVFWKSVRQGDYTLLASDIDAKQDHGVFPSKPVQVQTGIDCRTLPYGEESIDCVVLDPPYIKTWRLLAL